MSIDIEDFRQGLEVELEHGVRFKDANVTNNHPILTGKIVLAHLKEFLDYYKRLEVAEIEGDLFKALVRKDSAKVEALYSKLIEAKRELSETESEQLPQPIKQSSRNFWFFRNLLGWKRKARVWPGQAAPQRSIFATLMAVFKWRKHQIFMLALAGLSWPKKRWLRMLFVSQLPLAWGKVKAESRWSQTFIHANSGKTKFLDTAALGYTQKGPGRWVGMAGLGGTCKRTRKAKSRWRPSTPLDPCEPLRTHSSVKWVSKCRSDSKGLLAAYNTGLF